MLLTWSITSAIIIIIAAYYIRVLYQKWYWIISVPGTSFLHIDISGDMKKVRDLKQKFGPKMVETYGRLYRIIANGNPVLIMADPLYLQQVYHGTGVHHHPRGLGLGYLFEKHMGDCMGCLNGKEWTRLRKTVRPAMALKAAEDGAEVMKMVLDEWEEKTLKPLVAQNKPVHILDVVDELPMKTINVMFFGYDFIARKDKEISELRTLSASIMSHVFGNKWAACLPIYYKFDTTANQDLKKFQKKWLAFLLDYMSSNEREEGRGGVFDHVVKIASEEEPKLFQNNLQSKQLVQTLIEIIFANQDIAGPSYGWMFAHLAVYPDIAAQMASQYFSKSHVISGSDDVRGSFIPDKATMDSEYEEVLNFLNESARVSPILILGSQAILDKETKIGEKVFSPGTRISSDNYSINHHPKYWKIPEAFDPSRWNQLDEFTKRWCFSRFGNGVRTCPGMHYANLGMGNALLRLLTKYKLEIAEDYFHIMNSSEESSKTIHKNIPVDPNNVIVTPNLKVYIRQRK